MAVFQGDELWFVMRALLPHCKASFMNRARLLTAEILPEGAGGGKGSVLGCARAWQQGMYLHCSPN